MLYTCACHVIVMYIIELYALGRGGVHVLTLD